MTEQQFGRYQIIRELGRGGMATVYLAHDPRLERDVALKVLPREFLHDPEFLERFKREARTAALDHVAIVPVYDFGEADGQPFIVMKLMAGGSLEQRIARGAMSLEEALPVLQRIAQALDHAHSKEVIHRDLKPGNVLFDEAGNAFLSDFGIARADHATAKMTTGVIGTPAYMSPEQINAVGDLSGQSDQYTLALVTWEMLTGSRPFDGDTPQRLFVQHLLHQPPSLRDRQPALPGALDVPLQRALAKDPTERFPSCTAFVESLAVQGSRADNFPTMVDSPIATPPVLPAPATASRPNWLLLGAGAGVLVVCVLTAVGLGVFSLLPGLRGPAPTVVAVPGTATPRSAQTDVVEPPTSVVLASTNTATPEPTLTPTPDPYQVALALATSFDGRADEWTPVTWQFPDDSSGTTMVLVPPGCFEMGTTDAEAANALALGFDPIWLADEQLVTRQCLDAPFWIDLTEVTNGAYGSTGCADTSAMAEMPRNCINWDDARAYCLQRDARLPTELEWEYAAAGPASLTYPWGNEWDSDRVNWAITAPNQIFPVGSFASGASWVGALDMSGNVWEWTSSLNLDYPYSRIDGREAVTGSGYRIIRGGSFEVSAPSVRAANREWTAQDERLYYLGFRCARDP